MPICLFFTKDDELRHQLVADAPRCLEALAALLGHAVGEETGGDGPIEDVTQMSSEQLHARVIGSLTRAYEMVGMPRSTHVLDATNPDAARTALDSAVMLTLTNYAKSGRGQTSCTPSSNESGSLFDAYRIGGSRSVLGSR